MTTDALRTHSGRSTNTIRPFLVTAIYVEMRCRIHLMLGLTIVLHRKLFATEVMNFLALL